MELRKAAPRWARGAVIADEGSDGGPRLIQTDSALAA